MAKEKGEIPEDFTDRMYSEIQKDFGEGVLLDGNSVADEKKILIPLSPSLDIITSGGVMEGSFVGVTGNPKTGKTSLALTFAATCQLQEFGSRPVFYGNVEGRITKMHLKGIRGLNLAKPNFNIIRSIKGKILTAQEHLEVYCRILRNIPRCVLIIDSISALCDEREMTGGIGTETRGSGAKLFSQFLNLVSNVVPVQDSIVIGITHLMCNTSGMGAQYIEKATRRWHYQADYQLRTIMTEAWKSGEKQIGQIVKWACKCSKQGPPGMTVESHLRYGVGIDKLYETLNFGIAIGLVKKGGAWYSLDFLGKGKDTPKFQGLEKTYQAFLQNPEWEKVLHGEVLKLAGGLVGNE